MPRRVYTTEMNKFIEENVNGKTNREICRLLKEKFNIQVTEKAMNSYIKNHHIVRTTRASKTGLNSIFPKEIRNFIDRNSIGIGNQELADKINAAFDTDYNGLQVKGYKQRHGVSSGLTGHFEKGHEPNNKGKKMPLEMYKKCKATMFKKGSIPKNHREVGSERINVDGYIEIKIAEPNLWDLKHRVAWRNANGEISPEDKIIFLDGNKLNTNVNNLALISNQELLELNRKGLIKNSADLTEIGILIVRLAIATKNHK